jgi:hypothetical protein
VTPREKDAASGEPGKPDPPPEDQTPFQRFEEFARKVISVPRAEIEERERAYREKRKAGQ